MLILGVSFGVRYFLNTYKFSIYNKSIPAKTLQVNTPFESNVYFNNILGQDIFLDKIVEQIDNATSTVELAMFSFDSYKIKDALYRANDRGVSVTLLLDKSRQSKHDRIFNDLPKGIKKIDIGSYDPNISIENIYMHHKFLLIDRGNPAKNTLITGSMDFTSKGEKYEQSFYFITQDSTLISLYGLLFNTLKKDITSTKKLKEFSYNPWFAHIQYSDSYIDLWVSPGFKQHSIKYKVIDLIKNAQKNITILMWQFNDKEIAQALVEKAKKGTTITLISDDLVANSADSSIPYLQEKVKTLSLENFLILLDSKQKESIDTSILGQNFNPFIHHHAMIVDEKTLVIGTNNWTTWGFYKNDEDTIITDNKYLIGEFLKTAEFFKSIFK